MQDEMRPSEAETRRDPTKKSLDKADKANKTRPKRS